MGLSMKNKVFALALVVVGVLATGTFAADRHIRVGGNVALGYNTVGGVDEGHTTFTRTIAHDAFTKTDSSNVITGAGNLAGFGFELGGSVDFPITNSISLRANVLLNYRMHSGNMTFDTVYTKYSDVNVTNDWKKEDTKTKRTSMGEHSFNQFGLDIPVLCRMVLPTGDESGFYAEVGPVFTINLSTSTDDLIVKAEDVNKFSMGLSVGVGRPLPFEKVPVDIDVHMMFGLIGMAKDAYFNPNEITVRLGATYWFI